MTARMSGYIGGVNEHGNRAAWVFFRFLTVGPIDRCPVPGDEYAWAIDACNQDEVYQAVRRAARLGSLSGLTGLLATPRRWTVPRQDMCGVTLTPHGLRRLSPDVSR